MVFFCAGHAVLRGGGVARYCRRPALRVQVLPVPRGAGQRRLLMRREAARGPVRREIAGRTAGQADQPQRPDQSCAPAVAGVAGTGSANGWAGARLASAPALTTRGRKFLM